MVSPVGTGRGLGQSYQLVVIKAYYPSGYVALWLGLSQAPAKAWLPQSSASKPGQLPAADGMIRALKAPGMCGGAVLRCPRPTPRWIPRSLPFPLVMKYSCQQSRTSLGRLPVSSLRLAQAFKEQDAFPTL